MYSFSGKYIPTQLPHDYNNITRLLICPVCGQLSDNVTVHPPVVKLDADRYMLQSTNVCEQGHTWDGPEVTLELLES